MNSLREAVISVVLDSLNETKRKNKDKMAGALRSRADYIERGDEFDAAKNLRDIAKGREAGPKGGTGKDSPEAEAKRAARKSMQSTQRSPEDIVAKEKAIRHSKPTGAEKRGGYEPSFEQGEKARRLRVIASRKARLSGRKRFRSTDDGFDRWRDSRATGEDI